jgi:hypothetical protein
MQLGSEDKQVSFKWSFDSLWKLGTYTYSVEGEVGGSVEETWHFDSVMSWNSKVEASDWSYTQQDVKEGFRGRVSDVHISSTRRHFVISPQSQYDYDVPPRLNW